jgi:N-acetyl-gamma-glutamyl-phosphate reductase
LGDFVQATKGIDVVFLATYYEVSHYIALLFLAAGCVVFDLLAAFPVSNASFTASITISNTSTTVY